MTSEAQKNAQKTYDEKVSRVTIKYAIHEIEDYKKTMEHCNSLGITYQRYIKQLIRDDMKNWQ